MKLYNSTPNDSDKDDKQHDKKTEGDKDQKKPYTPENKEEKGRKDVNAM
jgi:hypothetical protein